MLFWKKKKRKKEKEKRIVYREPHIIITSPEQGNININFDAGYMQEFRIRLPLDTELRCYGQDSCDGYNHFKNEWNDRNLFNEAVLIYVMYWAILLLMYYFENNNFRKRVIHWHCLNWLSKLTTKKSTYKWSQRR